jgi:hypothetical protein
MRDHHTDAAMRPQPRRDGPDDWTTPADLCAVLVEHVLPLLPQGPIWDCCPGAGALVNEMEVADRKVIATHSNFMTTPPPDTARILVGNPPYNQLNKFTDRSLLLLDTGQLDAVAWLWRWDHIPTQLRASWVNRAMAVHCCSWRPRWIPGSTTSPRFTFAWITWRTGFDGPPRLIALRRPLV